MDRHPVLSPPEIPSALSALFGSSPKFRTSAPSFFPSSTNESLPSAFDALKQRVLQQQQQQQQPVQGGGTERIEVRGGRGGGQPYAPPRYSPVGEILGDLYRRDEVIRRRNPSYLDSTRDLFDLYIVMPVCIPYGEVVVDSPTGRNFYEFGKGHPGAQLLFGRPQQGKEDGNVESPSTASGNSDDGGMHPEVENLSLRYSREGEEQKPLSAELSTSAAAGSGPVCDTWASFLHIRLGTIYNLSADMLPVVVELFNSAFDPSQCSFLVPITLDCRGIFVSPDDSISVRDHSGVERYETRGKLEKQNDQARFRMIRRYLKKFARDVMLAFSNPFSSEANPHLPHVRVELHSNCRSSSHTGHIRVMVHEWSKVEDGHIQQLLVGGPGVTSSPPEVLTSSPQGNNKRIPLDLVDGAAPTENSIQEFSARVVIGEIRLEYTRLRMVDPRWPSDFVLGRRIADCSPDMEVPLPGDLRARFIFCDRLEMPTVRYNMSNPELLRRGRLAAICAAHLADYPQAVATFEMVAQSETSPSKQKHNRKSLGKRKDVLSEYNSPVSPNNSPFPQKWRPRNTQHIPGPRTLHPCRYFLMGGCARGDECFYLHSADPHLQCLVDVRIARESQNPKYF